MQKIFDTRVIALIEDNAKIWIPPDTIPPHERYLELYRPVERLQPIPDQGIIRRAWGRSSVGRAQRSQC